MTIKGPRFCKECGREVVGTLRKGMCLSCYRYYTNKSKPKRKEMTDDEKYNLIKSHLYDNLDVLKDIKVKREGTFPWRMCEGCRKYFQARKLNKDNLCKLCAKKRANIIGSYKIASPITLERIKNESAIINNRVTPLVNFSLKDIDDMTDEEKLQFTIKLDKIKKYMKLKIDRNRIKCDVCGRKVFPLSVRNLNSKNDNLPGRYYCESCDKIVYAKTYEAKLNKLAWEEKNMKKDKEVEEIKETEPKEISNNPIPADFFDFLKKPEPIVAVKPEIKRHNIDIDILDGLSEKQKETIIGLVNVGYSPMGFTVYVDTGEIYYFGKFIGVVK